MSKIPIILPRHRAHDQMMKIERWLAAPNERVEKGQPILETVSEAEGVRLEAVAGATGVISAQLFPEGWVMPAGSVAGWIDTQPSEPDEWANRA